MIELSRDTLVFSFPEVHPTARLTVSFQRTLRLPDDGRDYPLPPGFGEFPLRHVDDIAGNLPAEWSKRGGVLLPMRQAEAMWLSFRADYLDDHATAYPFAIKIAAGKINAVSGTPWARPLTRGPQDYVVAPRQPWLDGFNVQQGTVRQFAAMPLGEGYSAEEQLTGAAEHGGLQFLVAPMKAEAFARRFPKVVRRHARGTAMSVACEMACPSPAAPAAMGLAPGGRMRQEIYDDPYRPDEWDEAAASRCFVHLLNSAHWRAATGEEQPPSPVTAQAYAQAGLPWFEYYDEKARPVGGSGILAGLKSLAAMATSKRKPLPDNASVAPGSIQVIHAPPRRGNVVRETGDW